MTDSNRNQAFKARILKGPAMLLPGVANPLAARIAEDLNYEALYVTGAGVSNTNFGLPDIGLTGLTDVANAVISIRSVVNLPLVVDADTGFGNAVNVYHTVRTLEAAGANAIQLEDQDFPKRCGHFEGKSVIATSAMVDKIKAAADARRDSDLQIVARTDAIAVDGFEAAMDRAEAYIDAGADITFVEAVKDKEQMRAVPTRLGRPQLINIVHGGKTPPLPLAELDTMGFALILYANAALQASIAAMQRVLGELYLTGSLDGVAHELASFAERQRIVRKAKYDALESKYSSTDLVGS
jgi:2-methylisocitrate lyase-like PEP mutase family enzyme